MLDGVAQGAEFAEIVRGYVERATAPLLARIADLEVRVAQPPVIEVRQADLTPELEAQMRALAHGVVSEAFVITQDDYDRLAEQAKEHAAAAAEAYAAAAVAKLPTPKDGANGKDAEPVSEAQIAEAVARHLEANPPAAGKDGRDGVDGQAGRDGVDGAKGEPGRDGTDGQDGAAAPVVAGAIKDHTGELVLTLTDGLLLRTGIFDGAPGQDGANGQDGRDGLGYEDMTEELSADGRSVVRRYVRGDEVREFIFPLPGIFDCGVYKAGESYQRGDAVTWGGSLWIAQRQTADKPETSDAWRLSVKRGRDGKDGATGAKGLDGQAGPQGPPGRDRG